jgi:hypothetical protein
MMSDPILSRKRLSDEPSGRDRTAEFKDLSRASRAQTGLPTPKPTHQHQDVSGRPFQPAGPQKSLISRDLLIWAKAHISAHKNDGHFCG